ncbi:hypothetical protein BJY52DRAFT_1210289 [Lactarius psammicola]|nr:hypothetical protein BJY52DRAFT_1210289 [Lactarius psammicola]
MRPVLTSLTLSCSDPGHVWTGHNLIQNVINDIRLQKHGLVLLSLSYPYSDTQLAVGQVPVSESTRQRRISGLNSRFDRMLWEASLTARAFKSLPRRHKHAYSSSSSSISSHELATTSTHAYKNVELGSGELESRFVVVREEIQSHKTMPRIGAGLNPLPNNGDQAIAEFCPGVPLPNWLNNTLATLPPSHPVRRLILPLDRPVVRDPINHNPSVSDAGAVFAFQAPPCESHLLDHAGSDGHSGVRAAVTVPKPPVFNSDSQTSTSDSHGNPFEVTHNGSVEFRENTLAVLRTVPFSTPGPGRAISRSSAARPPWEDNSILSHTTVNGSQEAMDVPPPFSTPGPFASPRPVSGHVFSHPVAPHMPPDESDRVDTPLFPVQDGSRQFSALPLPGFTSNNLGLSSSPTPATEPTFPRDRGVVTPSPGLTWLSPVELRSGVNGNIAYNDVSMLISDDLVGQKTPFGTFSLSKLPISSKHEAESLSGLRRYITASNTFPRMPMALPQSMLPGSLPTDFNWASPDVQSPEGSKSTDQLDIVDVNAYTPAAVVVWEPMREASGIFAPTPGILPSPLLDAPDSMRHTGNMANGSARGISEVVSWSMDSVRDIF